MSGAQGFPAVASENAKVLVLGSMPGKASLEAQQYYAHPRNAFWQIMGEFLGFRAEIPYQRRLRILVDNRIALWDVLKSCYRPGSLDTSIDEESIVVNDFMSFYQKHPDIRAVFFNGAKAEQTYRKYVLPVLSEQLRGHSMQRLPSTSPANARLSLSAKIQRWRVVYEQTYES